MAENEAGKNKTQINLYNEKWIQMASDCMFAFLHLENSDLQKHGTALKSLSQQKSFGNNQCPKNITDVNNLLNNHRFDNSLEKSMVLSNKKENKDGKIQMKIKKEIVPLSFTQIEGR